MTVNSVGVLICGTRIHARLETQIRRKSYFRHSSKFRSKIILIHAKKARRKSRGLVPLILINSTTGR
jgi:hypothetical protein